ncbi:MAG: methionine sulfoxide reductase catalytic subunit, partial [Pseudomonadota bacterium]|nr:methionine sulfoxide reductase catalytic subunit [Pseudomonadota bacterium]
MLIQKPADILPSEITDRAFYQRRRDFIKAAAAGAIAGSIGLPAQAATDRK